MLHATFKSLWARRLRLALSLTSVVLGVAFVCGSLLFTAALGSSFDLVVKSSFADVNVARDPETMAEPAELTAEVVEELNGLDGVTRAVGVASSSLVFPLDNNNRLLSFPGAPGLAQNWHETPAADGLDGARIVEGRAPQADDEVVVDPATASRGGHAVGGKVTFSTPLDGLRHYTLVGIGGPAAGATAGASLAYFTLPEAQRIVHTDFTSVWIQTDQGADVAAVARAAAELLPAGFSASTGTELAAQTEELLDVGLGFVNTFLLVFAGIALLVAALLILNTFSILVAQRAQEIALLRAVGATRRQVRDSVLAEALLVGLVGATIGLGVGYGLAVGIMAALSAFGVDLGAVTPALTWPAVAASYGIGVGVTALAVLPPARHAARTRPIEALAEARQPQPSRGGFAAMVGVVLVELGLAGLVCATFLPVPSPLVWFGASAALLLAGMVPAAAVVGAPVLWLLRKAATALFGETGRLAGLNAARQPRRTAATAATLMIGLALVSTVAVLAASTTASVGGRLSADQRGDFVISPVGYQPFAASAVDKARGVDGVDAAFGFHNGQTHVNGEPVSLLGASAEGIERATSLEVVAGTFQADGDAVPALVAADYAAEQEISIGQLLDLRGTQGKVEVLVTGLHNWGSALQAGQIVVPVDAFGQVADASLVNNVVVFADEGADHGAVEERLHETVSELPTVAVSSVDDYAEARLAQFDQLFAVIYALLALAVLISVLGIVNTLSLSVLERTREIGLLRAVGLTRGQVRLLVTLESVTVALLGALLGVVLGLLFGTCLVSLLAEQGIDRLVVPVWQLAGFVVLAGLVGVLAAVVPARRAARLAVVDLISAE